MYLKYNFTVTNISNVFISNFQKYFISNKIANWKYRKQKTIKVMLNILDYAFNCVIDVFPFEIRASWEIIFQKFREKVKHTKQLAYNTALSYFSNEWVHVKMAIETRSNETEKRINKFNTHVSRKFEKKFLINVR